MLAEINRMVRQIEFILCPGYKSFQFSGISRESETDFLKIIQVLQERNISYRLREWHVLQILKDDLKVELGSLEHWYKGLPMVCETLQIDDYKINMLDLHSLREFYRQGMQDRAHKTEEHEKIKYEALRAKYEALEKVNGQHFRDNHR